VIGVGSQVGARLVELVRTGTWRHLLRLLDDNKKVACFESRSDHNQLYYAWESDAAPCAPVAELYLSGVYIYKERTTGFTRFIGSTWPLPIVSYWQNRVLADAKG
jgi:hypothetical protein